MQVPRRLRPFGFRTLCILYEKRTRHGKICYKPNENLNLSFDDLKSVPCVRYNTYDRWPAGWLTGSYCERTPRSA